MIFALARRMRISLKYSRRIRSASVAPEVLAQGSKCALRKGAKVDWEFRVPRATETVEVTRFVDEETIAFVWSGGRAVQIHFHARGKSASAVEVQVRGFKGRDAITARTAE